jgi:hypothetical protein
MKVPKLKSYDMLVFKQKKHGKSGINKLHYTRKIPFKYLPR